MVSIKTKSPPREFSVGIKKNEIRIKDCGSITLEKDEQITFLTLSGGEYDVAAKSWGFYATPSVNKRLKKFGFKTALVENSEGAVYVMIVETHKMDEFKSYCESEKQKVLEWLSDKPCQ